MKKLIVLLFGLVLLGCAAAPRQVIMTSGNLPPQPTLELALYVWNETRWTTQVELVRNYERKTLLLAPHTNILVRLKKPGEYRYLVVGRDPRLGYTGNLDGQFAIIPGRIASHEGRLAGYHLVIRGLRYNARTPYSQKEYFGGNGAMLGTYEYYGNGRGHNGYGGGYYGGGTSGERATIQTPAGNIEYESNWPLLKFLKGGE